MAIAHWDPFRDVLHLQNRMQSMLQDYARQGSARGDADTLAAGAFVPPVDIYEDADRIVLTVEAPGVAQDAFNISIENNTLSVRGERQWTGEQKEENYHRVERRYGSFHRAFTLPQTVDAEHVDASYDAGLLRIELRKRPEARSRQIKVQLGTPKAAATTAQAVPAPVGAPATPAQHAN